MEFLRRLLPAPDRDAFVRRVRDHLMASGVDPATIAYEPDDFRLRLGSDASGETLYLGNLFDLYGRAWPWQRGRLIAEFLGFRAERPEERPATFDEARAMLLPGVRDAAMFDTLALQATLDGQPPNVPPTRPLGSRLRACLFLDFPRATSMLHASDLERWGVSTDEAWAVALSNLEERSPAPGFERVADGLYLSTWADCYDPARLLLPRAFAALELEGEIAVAAPNWNRLVVAGTGNPEALLGLLVVAAEVTRTEPRPMSALPLVRRGDAWVDLELARGHVGFPLLKRSRVLELNALYGSQKELLERLHARDGTDVHVATYSAVHDGQEKDFDSYVVWSKGVVSLLPPAERVVFFDPDGGEDDARPTIDWDIVLQHAGGLMVADGAALPRLRVEAFPDAATLERMSAAQAARAGA